MARLLNPAEQAALEQHIKRFSAPASSFLTSGQRQANNLPHFVADLSQLLQDLYLFEFVLSPLLFERLKLDLHRLINELDDLQDNLEELSGSRPAPPGRYWISIPGGGRKLVLDEDLLESLANEGMRDEEIADELGCSRSTVIRRRNILGLAKRQYTQLSLEEIRLYVERALREGSGEEGEKGVMSAFRDYNIRVRRRDVRAILRTIDRGYLATIPRPVYRRNYRVPFINSLWHIDGFHKLIPWKIVIHGGVDGYSRMVVFMKASDNNEAATVLEAFDLATQNFGWPSRVRADHGKENWDVKKRMEEVRGLDRGSFIQGSSTHNQRIERMWVDLQRWCIRRYRKLFLHMEDIGILNRDDPYHLWALHFCFLPMINKGIINFQRRWNRHVIRTENASPRLMWTRSLLQAQRAGMDIMADPYALVDDGHDPELDHHNRLNFLDYGVDTLGRNAFIQPSEDDPHVRVSPILKDIPDGIAQIMSGENFQQAIQATAGSFWPPPHDFGIRRYRMVVARISELLELYERSEEE